MYEKMEPLCAPICNASLLSQVLIAFVIISLTNQVLQTVSKSNVQLFAQCESEDF